MESCICRKVEKCIKVFFLSHKGKTMTGIVCQLIPSEQIKFSKFHSKTWNFVNCFTVSIFVGVQLNLVIVLIILAVHRYWRILFTSPWINLLLIVLFRSNCIGMFLDEINFEYLALINSRERLSLSPWDIIAP